MTISNIGSVARACRKTISCENCRARKVKCSREAPCQHCLKRHEECVWKPEACPRSPRRPSHDIHDVATLQRTIDSLAARLRMSPVDVEELIQSVHSPSEEDLSESESLSPPARTQSPPSQVQMPASYAESSSSLDLEILLSFTPPPISPFPSAEPQFSLTMPSAPTFLYASRDDWLGQPNASERAEFKAALPFTLPAVETPSHFSDSLEDFDFHTGCAEGSSASTAINEPAFDSWVGGSLDA